MKKCFKCGKKKPLSAFYRHSMMSDGRLNKCKECTKKDVRTHRRANLDRYRLYDRERASLPHRKKQAAAQTKRSRKRVSQYMAAHNAVKRAIENKSLERQPCQMCGTKDWVAAHHDDYTKPLAVMWLCPQHHKARHAFLSFIGDKE